MITRKLFSLVAFWAVLTFANSTLAAQPALDAVAINDQPLSLTEHFEILDDPTAKLTLPDVLQPTMDTRFIHSASPAEALALGFTQSALWLRLRIKNGSDLPIERMLEIALSRHSSVQFHQPVTSESGTSYRTIDTGYSRPFTERPYKHRFFVFPITLPAQSEQVVYLRFHGPDGMDIPAHLWSVPAFHKYERDDYMTQAIYAGMVISMVTFNLLLGFALRDVNYLLYVLFISFTALNISSANGIGSQYFWGNSPEWAMKGTLILAGGALSSLILFMRRMLDTARHIPRMDRLLKLAVTVQLVVIIGLWFFFTAFLQLSLLSAIPTVVLILVCAFMVAEQNKRSATLFLGAFSVICLAGIITVMRSFALLPTNFLTTNGIQIGSAIEMLLLAFVLADRYNQLRKEKEAAQHQSLAAQTEALAAEQRVAENLRQSERLLEGRVTRRTAELSATVDRLKQTQAELVQAEKLASLGSLVAGVAHELNTPIGNALTTASALEDATVEFQQVIDRGEIRRSTMSHYTETAVAMAALVVKSCRRAAALVSSFKQVAVDQTSEQRRQFDLHTLVEDNIAALRPGFRHMPWQIVNEIPLGMTFDSYPGGLGQVVACLIENAFTHAFEGQDNGVLTISAQLREHRVELLVSDDGKGMSPEVLTHIFDPFYTTRLGQGRSGLGLSIASNIVAGLLGGTLTASSTRGKGTRFQLNFPQVAPANPKPASQPDPNC